MKSNKELLEVAMDFNEAREQGAAQICISLENSQIIVRHTHAKGEILFQKTAVKGDWDKIWAAIKSQQ